MSSRIVGSDPVTVKRSADELLAGNYSFRGEYSFSQKSSSGRSKSSRRANKSSSNSHLNKTGPVVLPKVDTGNRGRDRSRRPAKSSSRSRSVPRTAAWGAKEARKREGQLQKVNGDPKTRPLSYIRAYEDVDDSEGEYRDEAPQRVFPKATKKSSKKKKNKTVDDTPGLEGVAASTSNESKSEDQAEEEEQQEPNSPEPRVYSERLSIYKEPNQMVPPASSWNGGVLLKKARSAGGFSRFWGKITGNKNGFHRRSFKFDCEPEQNRVILKWAKEGKESWKSLRIVDITDEPVDPQAAVNLLEFRFVTEGEEPDLTVQALDSVSKERWFDRIRYALMQCRIAETY